MAIITSYTTCQLNFESVCYSFSCMEFKKFKISINANGCLEHLAAIASYILVIIFLHPALPQPYEYNIKFSIILHNPVTLLLLPHSPL